MAPRWKPGEWAVLRWGEVTNVEGLPAGGVSKASILFDIFWVVVFYIDDSSKLSLYGL